MTGAAAESFISKQTARAGGGTALLLAATLCAFVALISIFWVGFLGSDDSLYWRGAGGWLAHFPSLGDNHWALRHTLVIPMAIARALLGDGLPALLSPSLLYAVGFLIVTALCVQRVAGRAAAAAAMALVTTSPQFILLSSVANVDTVEIFFVMSALALIHGAMEPAPSPTRTWSLLFLAGASLGFAMLSRETSCFAVIAIGLLFLAGYGMRRARYLLVGIGFAAVVGLEFVFLWWFSGDVFYRAAISLHHDATTNRWLAPGAGVPLLHPLIDPVTMLLLNHNFGVIAWIGVPLAIWLTRTGGLSAAARRLAVLAITVGITWSVMAAGLWSQLQLLPRYFLLPALLLSILTGMALARLWAKGRRRLAGTLGVVMIGANLFSMSIDNRNYMYGEHVLVEIAGRRAGPIHTDPETLRRAEMLLRWDGTAERVTDTPPGPGELAYFNPARANFQPGDEWTVVERHGLPPTIGQVLASHLLPAAILSRSLLAKLGRGHPDVTLYRLP